MEDASRMRLAAFASAILLLTLTSCDGTTPDNEPRTQSTVALDTALAGSRNLVRSTGREVYAVLLEDSGALSGSGATVRGVSGQWNACTDDLAGWAYDVNGRIDLADVTSSIALLPNIRAALEAAGWEYDPSPVAADPRTSVTAFKGDLSTRVLAYPERFLLVAVSGPCLETSAATSEDLASHRVDEPLTLSR